MLTQGLQNQAFGANIPILDTSLKKIFSFAKAFTNKLYEFFVEVEPFEKRGVKTLKIEQVDNDITAIDTTATYELYVIRGKLPANPIAGNAQVLRDAADRCTITFKSYTNITSPAPSAESSISSAPSLSGQPSSAPSLSGQPSSKPSSQPLAIKTALEKWIDDVKEGAACSDEGTKVEICLASTCEAIYEDKEVQGYEACDCDVALRVTEDSRFVLYTVPYKTVANQTIKNDIKLVGLFEEYSVWSGKDPQAPDGAGDHCGIPCAWTDANTSCSIAYSLSQLTRNCFILVHR